MDAFEVGSLNDDMNLASVSWLAEDGKLFDSLINHTIASVFHGLKFDD